MMDTGIANSELARGDTTRTLIPHIAGSRTPAQTTPEEVYAFVEEYFDAWSGTDEDKILAHYSDEVTLQLPTGRLEGKSAVLRDVVRPFMNGFHANVHSIQGLAYASNLVAVEWSFRAAHTGKFAGLNATGNTVRVSGCSFYEYDPATWTIPAGRIYFDFNTLLHQLGADWDILLF